MGAYWLQGVNLSHVPVWPDGSGIPERVRYPAYDLGVYYTSAQRLYDSPRIPHVDEPQPGDLAFWSDTYPHPEDITHCMIWAGPRRLIGAQSPVLGEYANDSAWWRERFRGFGRPQR